MTIGGGLGREMDSVTASPTSSLPARQTFAEHLFVEQEKFNLVKSGRRWVGDVFDYVNASRTYTNALPGLATDATVMYRYSVLSRSATVDTFVVTENDLPLGSPTLTYIVDVRSSNNEGYYAYTATVDGVSRDGNIPNSRSILKFRFGTRNQSALGWLDWFEIHYTRRLEAVNEYLRFTTADTSGGSAYVVRGLANRNIQVFDITDHQNVQRLTGIEFEAMDPTTCRFGIMTVRDSVRSMIVAGNGAFKTLPAATRIVNTNLRGTSTPVDLVIITPTDFLPEAERLRAHRQQHDSMDVLVADLSRVYNEFSGGVPDVMAIRDFLSFATKNWPQAPRYVLLLGAGHYDYKGISTNTPNWIPPYESVESIYQIASYASDDHFVFLNPSDRRVALRIGRLPARTVAEARLMVDRIIQYDTAAPFDPWRTKVTFVADDDLTSTGSDGAIHTSQADELATRYTPNAYEKQKIYLVEYPTVNSAVGRRKPDVNRSIIDAINAGTLIINYTGHGNERLWAHEAVFTREEDIPRLKNADRLTFLVGATCNYAQYDDPIEQSSGEYVLVLPSGGAIGVVTASRAVYSSSNAALNEYLYAYLFQRGSDGMPARLGDAMWSVKQILNGTNDLKYHLLADPTLRLAMPRISSRFDSVNSVAWPNPSVVQTLGKVRVQGSVRALDGTARTEFSGRATVQFYDARRTVVVPQWGSFNYAVTGSSLYRGDVTVMNGEFRAVIPVPKDVTIGANARLAVYAWNDSIDAVGFTELVSIAGVDSAAVIDTTGPEIEIYFDDITFRTGDPVPTAPTLIVRLRDENGINTSTVGIGHRLEATIRNPVTALDLSQAYQSDLDTYQSGEARLMLEALPEGPNAIEVKAWDAHNNSSEASTYFVVRSSDGLVMENVLNYPNPMNGHTTFTFSRTSTNPVDVRVSIHTVTGRLIQTLDAPGIIQRQVLIPWDGRDADGDPVGNGLYFYRIRARDEHSGETAEIVGKLIVMR